MRFHPASSAVTRLELWFHDIELPHATGFIYSFGKELGLVTNWHVFTGVNPLTGVTLNQKGLTPNRVSFHWTEASKGEKGLRIYFRSLDVPLVEDGRPTWWQHPGYVGADDQAHLVDIAVLPLNHYLNHFDVAKKTIQSFESQVIVTMPEGDGEYTYQQGTGGVGSEVFILGFPRGLALQGLFPIWKRGSIASEPLYNLEDGTPVFLTDALTRDGMSGSPVLFMGERLISEDGYTSTSERVADDCPWLLGVYAGRRGSTADELEMAVGRVWKKALLDEVFMYQVPGGTPPQRGIAE